ncbi:probable methyltransferase PMT24 [Panicum virgatum]|nr:probable methyltransferase PMT24 [Panicum virgatum]
MMASSNNIAVTVSPENTKSGAKDQDRSVDFARSGDAVSDTPQTGGQVGDAVRKDNVDTGGGVGTTQTRDEAGDGDTSEDGAGDSGKKDDGAGAAQTTGPASNDVNRGDAAVTSDATGGNTTAAASATVAEGETPSKNQTFSDENGKTEGGEVAKPEDPDKKVEQSAEQETIDASNTTSRQAEKTSTDQSTDETGSQADKNNTEETTSTDAKDTRSQADDKNAEEASTDDKNAGGQQADNSFQETSTTTDADNAGGQSSNSTKETPAESEEASGGTAKNQTTLDDVNGKMVNGVKEDWTAGEKNSDESASSDKVDDDTSTGAASKDATSGGQNVAAETMAASASADGTNGTITDNDLAMNSSATSQDKKDKAELLPSGQAELLNETASAVAENGTFPTQAAASSEEKKKKKKGKEDKGVSTTYSWKVCNVSTGADYIPCLDNEAAIKKLKSTKHYEHRERHCPGAAPTCLVALPEGYRQPIPWPHSRDKIWYHNVPHTGLASYKGHQNWVKVSGEHLTFPGGGTQFKHGALHYIDVIGEALPEVAWGRRSRVVLDVGCGVASFGGFLFDKDALTMSFAPKDEHEAQVQFALERGIPAVSAVMGTKRLPFPGNAFDVVHCARCRVPWHIESGKLLLEANRLLRPGGLFVWSATPVYRKVPEDVEIWRAMAALTKSMCWEMIKRTSDTVDQTAMVVFKKPTSNECYDARPPRAEPPQCEASDDQDAAWNVTLRACLHRVPTDPSARGSQWPARWPDRLAATPYWLSADQVGVYGKPAPADQEHWRKVVANSYLDGMGIDWNNVRNVMDMRAVYGGFAAALRDMKLWVMNVVTIDSPDTLPVVYERGLFGMYHDWCESFSTYPRSYDLVHADHLFSRLKSRCKLLPVMVEVDRILRPEGKLIVRDDMATVQEVQSIATSLHWEVRMTVSKQGEGLLCVGKTMWRPKEVETPS